MRVHVVLLYLTLYGVITTLALHASDELSPNSLSNRFLRVDSTVHEIASFKGPSDRSTEARSTTPFRTFYQNTLYGFAKSLHLKPKWTLSLSYLLREHDETNMVRRFTEYLTHHHQFSFKVKEKLIKKLVNKLRHHHELTNLKAILLKLQDEPKSSAAAALLLQRIHHIENGLFRKFWHVMKEI
ncbi:hypothetical protein CCR75_008956 [Bremia lactucae]|uniref:RxLR effector protein n=1 Tax=Bremia lactucae TaxID=4779 RepID=A0A976FMK2_BRELC|nr:hypothetical protein CCR75_008956 [Bremia lactucae]